MAQHFIESLDTDLKQDYLNEVKILWTHGSTNLEGNTLTLGETFAVLTQGLTIGGKTLREHHEVVGHFKAIDLLYQWYQNKKITFSDSDLFELHKIIQNEIITDVYQPVGAYKIEPNSTLVVIDDQTVTNDTYALPTQLPQLMQQYLALLAQSLSPNLSLTPTESYAQLHLAFVHIHPFADGNGRMARLLANLPLIYHGYPPILIDSKQRNYYIELIAKYQLHQGRMSTNLLINQEIHYQHFLSFVKDCWQAAELIAAKYLALQKSRSKV